MEKQRISVIEAAKIMGVSPTFVRLSLQAKELPFGHAKKMSSKWTYYISPKLFYEYVGNPKENGIDDLTQGGEE